MTSQKNGWNDDGCGEKQFLLKNELDLEKKLYENEGSLRMEIVEILRL